MVRQAKFSPNLFVDIPNAKSNRRIQIYKSELGPFPFPRSATAVRALAQYRGAAGFEEAEAFQLLLETGGVSISLLNNYEFKENCGT